MSKIALFICLLVFSCTPQKITLKASFTLINKSKKKCLGVISVNDIGTKSLYVYNYNDSVSYIWEKTTTSPNHTEIAPTNLVLYNLSDTTKIEWIFGKIFDLYFSPSPLSHNDSIIKKAWLIKGDSIHSYGEEYYRVTIDSSLLCIFQKN